MNRLSSHRHYAFSLLEIMVVIAVIAILTGMMMYRHSQTINRSTFNQDVELFAANLKEMGTSAKRVGLLLPASIMSETRAAKSTGVPSGTINDAYMVWTIKEKKSSDSKTIITAAGVISQRNKVNVGISTEYTSQKSTEIKTGVWMDIFSIDDLADFKSMKYEGDKPDFGPEGKSPVACILYEPNQFPHRPGIITITIAQEPERSQRIDIERSGAITVNTVDKDKRLGD